MDGPRLAPFSPSAPRRGRHPAFRSPVRTALLASGALLVVGSLLSWLQIYLPYRGWFEISSFERAGDGLIALEIGILLLVLGWSDRAAESRLAIVVAAPLVLGIVALLVMRVAAADAEIYFESLPKYGGRGEYLPGFWLAVAGAAIGAVAGAARVFRARHDVRFAVSIQGASVAGAVGGVVGGLLGIVSAVMVGERLGPSSTLAGTAATFLALIFGLVGAWLGARVLRSFVPPAAH